MAKLTHLTETGEAHMVDVSQRTIVCARRELKPT